MEPASKGMELSSLRMKQEVWVYQNSTSTTQNPTIVNQRMKQVGGRLELSSPRRGELV